MSAGSQSDFDPDYINSMEHFESMKHEEIYAKTQQIDAARILNASVTWLEVAGTLASSFPLTRAGSDRVMNSIAWEGAAAEAAYASARSYADSVDELAAIMGQVGARLSAVAAAAETVKIAVVPPGNSGPIGTIARLLEAANVINAQMAEEALRQEAVLAMNMIYKPAYHMAGTAVPALPEPPPLPGAPAPSPSRQPRSPQFEYPTPEAPQQDQQPTPGTPAPSTPESRAAQPTPPPSTPGPQAAQPTPTPESQAPQPTPAPQPVPNQQPTPTPAPPTQQAPSPEPQSPAPAPPSQQAPSSTQETHPLPPAPPTPQTPAPTPQPQAPAPAPPASGPSAPLPDPAGQPGITGPIPEQAQQPPSTTNQPGVIPTPESSQR
ncbi:hypothetical protein AB0L63_17395 [Nocardia sp. NPDC051990]|uniref:hypothetical protein n=1 Tax=Nocardia sp. NPDC051990 TaxID=3155285 RepID=UPI00341AAAB3